MQAILYIDASSLFGTSHLQLRRLGMQRPEGLEEYHM